MAFKGIALIVCVLVVYQAVAFTVSRKERETKDAANSIDSFLDEFKTSFSELVSKMQHNELFQNISAAMKDFEQEVADGTKKFADETKRTFTTK